ncbi:MAG: phosphoadenosine phosphosulfate reductase family protein [Tannerellaceae bacterium]|nr:phosphoadenosine phosphosulfate reductase family protein [Tannerellaceae bacterium]
MKQKTIKDFQLSDVFSDLWIKRLKKIISFYDKFIIAFSGGKDSTALVLLLLELGIPKENIELWHHEIDGQDTTFFDWECTSAYCKAFADALGIKILFQGRIGGFRREMLRNNENTAPVYYELQDGTFQILESTRISLNTRLKFPQITSDLSRRYCSAYLKIDVCKRVATNDTRLRNQKILFLSGERAEESPQRAKYRFIEKYEADLRNGTRYMRHMDRLRLIKYFSEEHVWSLIKKYRIRVHPCYYIGYPRCSCKFCIFLNKDQYATSAFISPSIFKEICSHERNFGWTMKRDMDIQSFINPEKVFKYLSPQLIQVATSYEYNLSIILPKNEEWILPQGAFGVGGGAV